MNMVTLCALAFLMQDDDAKAGYDGGFYVQGADAKLTMEGLLQVDATTFGGDSPHVDEFELRRMRLEFSGDFHDRWLFHVEPNFAEDGVELEEAWIGVQLDEFRLHIGRMKEPFSLEEMSSRRHMDMVNFSLLNQFVPAEDHGLTLLGRSGPLELGIGFYNGTGGPDTTSDKDAALRVVVHLFDGFQLGGAGTVGRQSIDISGEELITEARAPWAQYLPGTTVSGDRVRLGTEAAWLTGPFAATAEWMILREDLNDETVHVRGGYLQASYVLTGEDKTWKGVIPAHPFEKDPDVGAWQVVGRWSHLDPDESFENFLTADPNRLDSFTVGLNWHANRFAKAKLNVIRSAFEERIVIDGESIRTEDALIVQFQLQF